MRVGQIRYIARFHARVLHAHEHTLITIPVLKHRSAWGTLCQRRQSEDEWLSFGSKGCTTSEAGIPGERARLMELLER